MGCYGENMSEATETLTTSMIDALRRDAGEHGDDAMVHICWLALGESVQFTSTTPDAQAAREQCADVISEARANAADGGTWTRVVA